MILRDIKGHQIFPGDLLRTPHFRAALRRKMHYLYHVAVQDGEHLFAVPTCYLNPGTKEGGGRYILTPSTVGSTRPEIIHGHPWVDDRPKVRE